MELNRTYIEGSDGSMDGRGQEWGLAAWTGAGQRHLEAGKHQVVGAYIQGL